MQRFTRQCSMCHKHRDAEELFHGDGIICLLCVRKAERDAEGRLHTSHRQLEARNRSKLMPAERYRRQLASAGYLPEQIDRYVAANSPEESTA